MKQGNSVNMAMFYQQVIRGSGPASLIIHPAVFVPRLCIARHTV
jgi:hypothetical protein